MIRVPQLNGIAEILGTCIDLSIKKAYEDTSIVYYNIEKTDA